MQTFQDPKIRLPHYIDPKKGDSPYYRDPQKGTSDFGKLPFGTCGSSGFCSSRSVASRRNFGGV